MESYIVWFVAAGVLVGAELLIGTLYLLMIALGAAAAGVVALAGAPMVAQFICATVLSVAGIAYLRKRRIGMRQSDEKTNIAFDTGQAVEVLERRADGSLRVNYRGTQWDATLEAGAGDGPYVIRQMRGNQLVLGPRN